MDNLYITFRFADDPEQKFTHARFPALPRVGDAVRTPPPNEVEYEVVNVCFDCEGSHADETLIVLTLRRLPQATG